jgi:hypothetical protein
MKMEFWSTSFAAPKPSDMNLLAELVGNYPPMPLVTQRKLLGNSGKPVTLEMLSLTKFSKHVFQEQGIHDFRKPGACEALNSRMCKVRES